MRRTYAALLCFVWLLAIEVLPNIHLALHDDARPHTHAVDGTVVVVTFESTTHSHDGIVHSHADAHDAPRSKRRARDVLAIDEVPDLHVASGLAHRTAALHEAPPVVLDVLAIDRVVTVLVATPTGRASVALVTTADARGPPIRQS